MLQAAVTSKHSKVCECFLLGQWSQAWRLKLCLLFSLSQILAIVKLSMCSSDTHMHKLNQHGWLHSLLQTQCSLQQHPHTGLKQSTSTARSSPPLRMAETAGPWCRQIHNSRLTSTHTFVDVPSTGTDSLHLIPLPRSQTILIRSMALLLTVQSSLKFNDKYKLLQLGKKEA